MKKVLAIIAVAGAVLTAACTHASISSVPMEIEGVGTVYRYQGRANFAHQIAEADRLITEDCKARNGGQPVIVDLQKRDIGSIAVGGAQSNTQLRANAVGASGVVTVAGTANTTTTGTTTAMRNYNQDILYKCVTDQDLAKK